MASGLSYGSRESRLRISHTPGMELPDARDGRDRAGPRNSRRAERKRAGAHPSVVHRPLAEFRLVEHPG
jgi:hypothetical protein